MVISSTWTSAVSGTPEELGLLKAGPGRAAEVAVARLLDADLIRISRDGTLTAVQGHPRRAATPLEAVVLRGVDHRQLGHVIVSAAYSAEANALKDHLVSCRMMRSRGQRSALRAMRMLLFLACVFGPLAAWGGIGLLLSFPLMLVVGLVVARNFGKPLTASGRRIVKRAQPHDRVHAVAIYGLRGKAGGYPVAQLFGISAEALATMPRKSSGSDGGSSCGSGCGSSSCSSSGGSSCGGGGCGGGGGD